MLSLYATSLPLPSMKNDPKYKAITLLQLTTLNQISLRLKLFSWPL